MDDQSERLQFALMFDGFSRYIESEAAILLNPSLVGDVVAWQASTMPLSYADLSKLYARVGSDDMGGRCDLAANESFQV